MGKHSLLIDCLCIIISWKKTGQICERCLPEKDGGKRQEKNGSAEEKTPHRRWRCKYNN